MVPTKPSSGGPGPERTDQLHNDESMKPSGSTGPGTGTGTGTGRPRPRPQLSRHGDLSSTLSSTHTSASAELIVIAKESNKNKSQAAANADREAVEAIRHKSPPMGSIATAKSPKLDKSLLSSLDGASTPASGHLHQPDPLESSTSSLGSGFGQPNKRPLGRFKDSRLALEVDASQDASSLKPPIRAVSPLASSESDPRTRRAEVVTLTGQPATAAHPQQPVVSAASSGDEDERDEAEPLADSIDKAHLVHLAVVSVAEEKGSERAHQSTVKQIVDKAFYSTMEIDPNKEAMTMEEPLHIAIASGEAIDVEMLLDSLGDKASTMLLRRDSAGRTALHVAAMVKSEPILTMLLGCYRDFVYLQAGENIKKLHLEYVGSVAELTKKFSKQEETRALQTRVAVVKDWFRNEFDRLKRQAEFRIEAWWIKAMSTRDEEGRIPLHYACSVGASPRILELLLRFGRGNFSTTTLLDELIESKSGKKKIRSTDNTASTIHPALLDVSRKPLKLLQDFVLYDIKTGLKIADCGSQPPSDPPAIAEAKPFSRSWDPSASKQFREPLSSGTMVVNKALSDFRNIAWDLSTQGMIPSTRYAANLNAPQPNYDVVVPWLLRSLLNKCKDVGAKSEATGVDILGERIHRFCGRSDRDILLIVELKNLLGSLGIRVTVDVLQELARRYPADVEKTMEKWDKEKSEHLEKLKRKQLAERKGSVNGSGGSKDAKGGDLVHRRSDDDKEIADSKHVVEARGSFAKDGDENSASTGSEEKKLSRNTFETLMVQLNSDVYYDVEADLNAFRDDDKELGVDIGALLDGIRSGSGLLSMDLSGETFSVYNPHSANAKILKAAPPTTADAKDGPSRPETVNLRRDTHIVVPEYVTIQDIRSIRAQIINDTDNFGRTPLFITAAMNDQALLELLLANRADVSIATPEGFTAVSIAKDRNIRFVLEKRLVTWLNGTRGTQGTATSVGTSATLTTGKESSQQLREQSFNALYHDIVGLQSNRWSYSRSSLSWAVNNGFLETSKRLLAQQADPNATDMMKRGPLHECATLIRTSKDIEAVKAAILLSEELINNGADINLLSISGRSCLHEVFCRNQDENVSYIAGLDIKSKQHDTHGDIFKYLKRLFVRNLLHWGADPMVCDRHGLAPIHYCAKEDAVESMLEILLAGFDPTHPTGLGYNCLHVACSTGSYKVAQLLVRWDADGSPQKCLNAKLAKNGKIARQMLANTVSSSCLDTLWTLARAGDLTKVHNSLMMIQRGNNPSALWERVETAEEHHALVEQALPQYKAILSNIFNNKELWLLDGVDAKTRRFKWTPLHMCIIGWAEYVAKDTTNRNTSVRRALGIAPPPRLTTGGGSSPVKKSQSLKGAHYMKARASDHISAQQYKGILLALLENHAFIDVFDRNCRTPLMVACACNLADACAILIDAGANVNATDVLKNSPLHYAYMFGCIHIVTMLEERGADTNALNSADQMPIDVAGLTLSDDYAIIPKS